MRIETTDERDRLYSNLVEATGQRAKSKAIDDAARYYLRMHGGVAGYAPGTINKLLTKAEQEGSLTAPEIAEILDERELSVEYETSMEIGSD